MKKTTIVFILSFISFGGFSQSWNLQQCIDYALKNNPTIKQNAINTDINKVSYDQSKAAILPSVNAGGNHTYNMGQTIDRYTNKFANATVLSENFYAQAQVTLWSGLQQYNNVKRNQFTYLSSRENYEQQKNDLALNVASSFLQVVYSTELLKVADNQVKISQQQLDRTQKLADAGATAMSSVYDIKAQLATDQYGLVTAQNNYNLALLALKQLLYLDSLNSFAIEKPAFELSAADLAAYQPADIYQTALKTQHKIKSSEYNLMSSEKNLSYAKGRVSPSLSFAGTLGTGYSGLDQRVVSSTPTLEAIGVTGTSHEIVYVPSVNTVTEKTPWSAQLGNNLNKSLAF